MLLRVTDPVVAHTPGHSTTPQAAGEVDQQVDQTVASAGYALVTELESRRSDSPAFRSVGGVPTRRRGCDRIDWDVAPSGVFGTVWFVSGLAFFVWIVVTSTTLLRPVV